MKQTGTHKKKEERFNPSGQLLWVRRESKWPGAPRLWCSLTHCDCWGIWEIPRITEERKTGTNQTTNGPQISHIKNYKKKEERFYINGQLLWDRRELKRPGAPRLRCSLTYCDCWGIWESQGSQKTIITRNHEIFPSNGLQTWYFAAYYNII